MAEKPLVLDVDGTFLRTDMLLECFWAGLGQAPLATLSTSFRNLRRPEVLKADLARIVQVRTDLMPVNPEIAELAVAARSAGREVVLASASDQTLVTQLATDHGLEGRVFASDGETNLKGARKAAALVEAYGEGGFDYAGNASVDRAVWDHADTALVVGDERSARVMAARGKPVQSFAGGWRMTDLIRALRPHQWVKNILLFVPTIAAHDFSWSSLFLVILGMMAFSAAASSIYIVNDLLDLEADRLHVKKCRRPFAAGTVPIGVGMGAFFVLAAIALGIGAWIGLPFFLVTLLYMAVSLAYSLRLKRLRWVDIAMLASLYTLRVVAGAMATGVLVTGFLMVFIFPVFIALGAVKRLTELTLATSDARLPGRGYARTDRGDLLNVAGLGVAGALLSFFLYSFTQQALALYPTQWLLWVAEVPIAWWLIRMVRLGYTGKQDYDPIIFAMKDKRGIGLMLIALSIMFYAAGLWHEWFGLS
ncbi:UbiA family prenyltransferase [Aliiroseovarius subalbicans]|uniref:UbiA family prenyltransferase n=1 Tax=Aliiroseovarius subalbicans TaxID=2925840 RepID=UPI001F57C153|nr:UbiA family prenyltransferase [Aliiroseovarius subalbicans]MCI2397970.1 UbiA family prenyltransferase [Aliiroseovarius subalbicans]